LLKSIEEQARALAPEDRARLAESMLESLQPLSAEIEAAWAEEIEERVSASTRARCLHTPLKTCLPKRAKLCGETGTLCCSRKA